MRPPLRVAILETDTPLEIVRQQYGNYGDIFSALLKSAADGLNEPSLISSKQGLEISSFHVVNDRSEISPDQYPREEDIDAVLITGSKYNAYGNDPWIVALIEYVQKLLKQDRIRIIGVCFGHQIVGRAMGVKVGKSDKGWEISVSLMKMSEKGKELFGKDIVSIHQMHRDIVYECPEGVELLGSSPACEVQGLYAKGRLISVQGHPEFTGTIVKELLDARHAQGIIDDETYKSGMDRVGNHHDGVTIAQVFLSFLLEDRSIYR